MHKAMKGLRFPLLTLGALLVTAAGCQVEREPNMEFAPQINHMMFSSAAESFAPSPVNAKTGKPVFANGRVNQLPPAGTIPRDFVPLHFSNDEAGRLAAAAAYPTAPVEASPENLARGAWGFATFCVPCHDAKGGGAGLVAKKAGWNFPIGYTDSNAGKWADGYLFHIVSYGRNNMPSYASQINQLDRWKIILHLRALQQQNGAAPVDPAAAATATAPAAAATPAAK